MPKIWKHSKNIYSEAEERQRTLIWILHKILEIIVFSANVHHCNIAVSVVHEQVCFKSFLFSTIFIFFLRARVEQSI